MFKGAIRSRGREVWKKWTDGGLDGHHGCKRYGVRQGLRCGSGQREVVGLPGTIDLWAIRWGTSPKVGERGPVDIETLANLLRETSEQHDAFEKLAPRHDWWDWYGAYMSARKNGSTSNEASSSARKYMEDARGIVVR
jgi:hypothetical protein